MFGASQTLASGSVRYIEFEYNAMGVWLSTNLSTVIDYLDGFGYQVGAHTIPGRHEYLYYTFHFCEARELSLVDLGWVRAHHYYPYVPS